MQRSPKTPRRTTLALQPAISIRILRSALRDASYQQVNSEKYLENIFNDRQRSHAALDLSCKLRFQSGLLRSALGDPSYQRASSENYLENICNVRRRQRRPRLALNFYHRIILLSYQRVNSENYVENICNVRRRQRRPRLAFNFYHRIILLSYQRVNSENYVENICSVRRRHNAALDLLSTYKFIKFSDLPGKPVISTDKLWKRLGK